MYSCISRVYEYFDFTCAAIYLFLICISLFLSISPVPLFCRLATFSSLLRPVSAVNSFCFGHFAYANQPSFDFLELLFVCQNPFLIPSISPANSRHLTSKWQFLHLFQQLHIFTCVCNSSIFELSYSIDPLSNHYVLVFSSRVACLIPPSLPFLLRFFSSSVLSFQIAS